MKTKNKNIELIPKKLVAVELYDTNKKILNLGIIAIAGIIIATIIAIYNDVAGAITAAIISVASSYFIIHARRKMLYLNSKYQLGK